MTGYRELLEREVVEAWRTYRLAAVVGLFLLLGILSAVATRYLPALVRLLAPPDYEIGLTQMAIPDVLDHLVRNVVQLGAVVAILLTMGSVAGERERGTASFVLVKPVTRAAFLGSKWVALAMLFALATGLAVLAAWLYTGILLEPPPVLPWIQLALVMWLAMMVHVSITFAGSAILGSPLAAGGLGFLGLVGLSLASFVPTLAPWLPSGLIEIAKSVALQESSIDLDPVRTVTMSLLVIAACLVVAWLGFRRQDV